METNQARDDRSAHAGDEPHAGPGIARSGRNPGMAGSGLDRSSEIVSHAGVAYFVATPPKPYDAAASAAEQMRGALEKVDARLARVGATRADLLMVQIWLRDMRYFREINEVWDGWIDQDAMPVRCCCACEMGSPDMKLELIVTCRAPRTGASARSSAG